MTFAFNTPPSLLRTPSDFIMNTLPTLPTELLSTWSMHWRPAQQKHSPMLSPLPRPKLPPIAFLQRHLSDRHVPLTPTEDVPPPHYSPPTRLPPINHYDSSSEMIHHAPKPPPPLFTENTDIAVDWLDFTHKRSAHFIAEKTCEMICYLWFTAPSPNASPSETDSNSLFNRPNSATTLQLVATPTFVSFMQKLLETTQVSQSVIVLSLHYIYRLKERNRFTPAQAGSEFRIAVAGLMMANKFLDDNTYTNKTWSEVSGIDLTEINRMEREFLMGVDCNLYVDKPTYESWLNLLKGLVLAKEHDSRQFRKSRTPTRAPRHPGSLLTNTPHRYAARSRAHNHHRARSTSPEQSHRTLAYPSISPQYVSQAPVALPAHTQLSPSLRSGAKRTAGAAFSPTSATFSHMPSKRPVSITLQIPADSGSHSGPNSSSPLEGLQSFARMSIDSPNPAPGARSHATTGTTASTPAWSSAPKRDSVPETLVTAYALDERKHSAVPQNLYFYSLACSPTDEESRSRKGRLRYHQPPPPSSSAPCYQPRPSIPINVQSASTSPNDVHISVVPTLPHFHDTVWTRQPSVNSIYPSHSQPQTQPQQQYVAPPPPTLAVPTVEPPRYQTYHAQPPQLHQQQQQQHQGHGNDYDYDVDIDVDDSSPIQSAPFANAGPPGFQFCPTPERSPASSLYVPTYRGKSWGRRSICQ